MSNEDRSPQDYEVGYKKPPKKNQFAKGKSGNPKGRPRKAGPVTGIMNILDETVTVRTNDGSRTVTPFEASVRAVAMRAIKKTELSSALAFINFCEVHSAIAVPMILGGTVTVARGWDADEYLANLSRYGPPPWPGPRSGMLKRPELDRTWVAAQQAEKDNGPKGGRSLNGPKSQIVREIAHEVHEVKESEGVRKITTLHLVVSVIRKRAFEGTPRAVVSLHKLQEKYCIKSQDKPRGVLVFYEKSTDEEWEEMARIQQAPYRGNNVRPSTDSVPAGSTPSDETNKATPPTGKIRTGHF